MRLAYVTSPVAVNSTYRAYLPLRELMARGHGVHHNRRGEPSVHMPTLLSADAVLVHRFTELDARKAMRQLREAGVGVIWDNDDDITNIPRSNPHYKRMGGLHRQRVVAELEKTLALADVVTTPSARLAEQFRGLGAQDVRVVENFLPPEFDRVALVPHEGVVVAWLAGLEHQLDYQQLQLRHVFERLLDAHPDLRFLSIGLGLGLPADRYEHIPLSEFFDLAPRLAHADIGLAPLVDVPWNQARSNIKLKEYGAAGLPWLASPVGAYVGMGEQQGGRLVADEDWYEAIDELIRNARARRKLAKRVQKWAREQSVQQRVHEWEAVFRVAADAGARRRLAA